MSTLSSGKPQTTPLTPTTEVITPGQLAAASFTMTMCGTLFLFPSVAVQTGGRSGWLLAFPAGVYALLTGLLVISTVRAVPGRPLSDIILDLLGTTFGRVMAGALALLVMVSAAMDYRLAVEPIETVFFDHTPLWVIVALLGMPSTYLAWTGPVRMSRLFPLLAGIIVLGYVVTLFVGSGTWDYGYLLPLHQLDTFGTGNNLWASLFIFRTAFAVAFLLPYYPQSVGAVRPYIAGLVPAGLLLAASAAVPIAAFGPWGARDIIRPFMETLGTLSLPNSPLTRIEFLIRLFFQANIIGALALQTYGAASLLSRALHLEDNATLILMAGIPPIAAAGWFASDPGALALIKPGVALGSLILALIFVFLWVVSRIRRSAQSPPENQENAAD